MNLKWILINKCVGKTYYEVPWLMLVADLYRPSASIAFVTMKPTVREIFAAPFCDRLVHHFFV